MSQPAPPQGGLSFLRHVRALLLGSTFGPLLGLAAVMLFFGVADAMQTDGGYFASARNVRMIAAQTATVAVAALGMTVIIISGGIDLSAGTAIALCAVTLAWSLREDVALLAATGDNVASAAARLDDARQRLAEPESAAEREALAAEIAESEASLKAVKTASAHWTPWTPPLAVVLTVLVGGLCGALNGLLVGTLRVVPFIITLGTMTVFLGLAKIAGNETTVRPLPDQVPDWLGDLTSISSRSLWPRGETGVAWVDGALDYVRFPIGVWLALLLAGVLAALLRYTVFGRHVFALGSNERAARLCGINVWSLKVAVYSLGGVFVGLGGVYLFSRLSNGSPTAGTGMELKIIAAVVIGGGSLSGGRGSVLGTLAGAAIMSVVESGCTQLGLRNPYQDILLGVIIIAAVTLDQLRQRRLTR